MTLIRSVLARLRVDRLLACRRGNMALVFALALLPLSVAAGFGVDITRQRTALSAAQAAVDAAIIAAATTNLEDEEALKDVFDTHLEANADAIGLQGGYTTVLSIDDDAQLSATLRGTIPAYFGALIGNERLPIETFTAARRGTNDFVELVLVLDNTWSMSASDGTGTTKIAGLKTAASALVRELMVTEDGKVKISVVPYADYVNVGTGNRGASWLNVPADYSTTSTPAPRTCRQVPVTTTSCTGGVRGTCTRFRDGVPETYSCWTTPQTCTTRPVSPPRTTEQCTGGGSPVTTWYRWFGCVRSRNVGDLRLNDTQPGTRYNVLMQNSQTCLNPILPLSETKATVLSRINGLVVNIGGYRPETYIPSGMVWGINALSPGAPFTEGRAYGPNVRKIIVLMTDGENTLRYQPTDGTHVVPNAATRASQLNATNTDLPSLCTYAKSQNMEIYTVGLGVASVTAENILRSCATSAAYAHNANDTSALIAAFQRIARSINAVRLAK
jgi:Flp pilus assembly protein TadG